VKHLYLLRHGKSSWTDQSLPDADRPLAPRGVRALGRMRTHLRKADIHPDLVICSPALRTRHTLAVIALPDRTWPQLEQGGGTLEDLVVARELG
jgi:phosphohistidine phosphatase